MPPAPIVDLAALDLDKVVYTRDEIYQQIPQRHEFCQLDAIVHLDTDAGVMAGYRDVRDGEWWCRGHIPGNPIFPGVLMMECAAQMAAFFREMVMPSGGFLAFGGVDNVKFRGAVAPPCRIVLVVRAVEKRLRRFVCDSQAYVDGTMVFHGRITGMPVGKMPMADLSSEGV